MEERTGRKLFRKPPDWGLLGPIFQNEEVGETHEAGRSGEKDGNEGRSGDPTRTLVREMSECPPGWSDAGKDGREMTGMLGWG